MVGLHTFGPIVDFFFLLIFSPVELLVCMKFKHQFMTWQLISHYGVKLNCCLLDLMKSLNAYSLENWMRSYSHGSLLFASVTLCCWITKQSWGFKSCWLYSSCSQLYLLSCFEQCLYPRSTSARIYCWKQFSFYHKGLLNCRFKNYIYIETFNKSSHICLVYIPETYGWSQFKAHTCYSDSCK